MDCWFFSLQCGYNFPTVFALKDQSRLNSCCTVLKWLRLSCWLSLSQRVKCRGLLADVALWWVYIHWQLQGQDSSGEWGLKSQVYCWFVRENEAFVGREERRLKDPTINQHLKLLLLWKQTSIRKVCFKVVEMALMRKTQTCADQSIYHFSCGLGCSEEIMD